MHVIHLLQDGRHAGEILSLQRRSKLLITCITVNNCPKKEEYYLCVFLYRLKDEFISVLGYFMWMSVCLLFKCMLRMYLSRAYFSCNAAVCLTMRGEDLSMLMTVRLTLRRSRSIISWTCPLVGPCTDRTASGTITRWNTATQTRWKWFSGSKGRFHQITKKRAKITAYIHTFSRLWNTSFLVLSVEKIHFFQVNVDNLFFQMFSWRQIFSRRI